MRAIGLALACVAAAFAVGCGSDEDYANDPRPPSSINVSAAISQDQVTVSPAEFGAGPVTLLIANLTDSDQELTIETRELSQSAGIKQTSAVINPQGTGTLKVDIPQGNYVVSVKGDSIESAQVRVGAERESSQDQLLQP